MFAIHWCNSLDTVTWNVATFLHKRKFYFVPFICILKATILSDWCTSSSNYMVHIIVGQMMKACYTHICRVLHFVHIQPTIFKWFAQCCKHNRFEIDLRILKKWKNYKISKFNACHTNNKQDFPSCKITHHVTLIYRYSCQHRVYKTGFTLRYKIRDVILGYLQHCLSWRKFN